MLLVARVPPAHHVPGVQRPGRGPPPEAATHRLLLLLPTHEIPNRGGQRPELCQEGRVQREVWARTPFNKARKKSYSTKELRLAPGFLFPRNLLFFFSFFSCSTIFPALVFFFQFLLPFSAMEKCSMFCVSWCWYFGCFSFVLPLSSLSFVSRVRFVSFRPKSLLTMFICIGSYPKEKKNQKPFR